MTGYLKDGDYPALERYMGDLTGFGMEIQGYVKHPELNALISSRAAAAKKADIDFSADISLPANYQVADVDLYVLFGNILDNAFEAGEKAAAPRFVNLRTRVENSYWVVVCRNATREQGRLRTVGHMKSTKDAEGIHGIGTKQIQKIAERYGGFVTYRHENYEFTTLATIKPLQRGRDDSAAVDTESMEQGELH
jgi:sensor histidine kinase regulating citrate/malate metabolism